MFGLAACHPVQRHRLRDSLQDDIIEGLESKRRVTRRLDDRPARQHLAGLRGRAMREARFTVLPNTSRSRSITGPAWIPACAESAPPPLIVSTRSRAAFVPRIGPGNRSIAPSPSSFTNRPPWRVAAASASRCRDVAVRTAVSSPRSSVSLVNPDRSTNTIGAERAPRGPERGCGTLGIARTRRRSPLWPAVRGIEC
jgi:hypothetical protein